MRTFAAYARGISTAEKAEDADADACADEATFTQEAARTDDKRRRQTSMLITLNLLPRLWKLIPNASNALDEFAPMNSSVNVCHTDV